MNEPSFLWKKNLHDFPCKGVVELEVMNNWRSEPSFLWKQYAQFFSCNGLPRFESSGRKNKSPRACLCLTHNPIGYSLQNTGFNGSMPCRKSGSSNKAGGDNILNKGVIKPKSDGKIGWTPLKHSKIG